MSFFLIITSNQKVWQKYPPFSWIPSTVQNISAFLPSWSRSAMEESLSLPSWAPLKEFTIALNITNYIRHHQRVHSAVSPVMALPCLCCLNYLELFWHLHSACQVSTAIIMQLWSFILRLYTPTLTSPKCLNYIFFSFKAMLFFFFCLHRICCSLFQHFPSKVAVFYEQDPSEPV